MTSSGIIPSKLYRLKIFESVTTFVTEDGGRRRVDNLSTPDIETQVNQWVTESGCLIVTTGPLNAFLRSGQKIMTPNGEHVIQLTADVEVRSLSVVYVPPVEQKNDVVYGQQQGREVAEVAKPAEPNSPSSNRRISDGKSGAGRSFRFTVPASKTVTSSEAGGIR